MKFGPYDNKLGCESYRSEDVTNKLESVKDPMSYYIMKKVMEATRKGGKEASK